MSAWLSSIWEANWRSFQYFSLYRLVLAVLFGLSMLFPNEWSAQLHVHPSPVVVGLTALYVLLTGGGLWLATYWQKGFEWQLTAQVMADVAVMTTLVYLGGGANSGVSVVLLISLAAASLVGRGRLVVFYAALASIGLLLAQVYGILAQRFEPGSIVQAGIVSVAYFATAILARLLGQRTMVNEELARRRGIALNNQILISRHIVERVLDGILIVGRDGLVTRSNPVARTMLGLPGEERPVALVAYAKPLAQALAAWQCGEHGESVDFRSAGKRELRARFERTDSSDGEVLVFLEDQGRIKDRAQQMVLASLGRLTASIAHEIRNPLSAIGHAGALLREERRGNMQDRLLRIVADNVARLDRIVSDILELGRQPRGEAELVPLAGFCAAFLDEFGGAEGAAPGCFVLEEVDEVDLCFDRAHLHQVLWNLTANALRHSSRGEGAVRFIVRRGETEGQVELHVVDDGPGVPEKDREQIFEPFFTTHTKGTGLGLFIARELCAANGARLELAPTEETGGAHFIVSGRSDTCLLPEASGARVAN